jgi:hypothetical protein
MKLGTRVLRNGTVLSVQPGEFMGAGVLERLLVVFFLYTVARRDVRDSVNPLQQHGDTETLCNGALKRKRCSNRDRR